MPGDRKDCTGALLRVLIVDMWVLGKRCVIGQGWLSGPSATPSPTSHKRPSHANPQSTLPPPHQTVDKFNKSCSEVLVFDKNVLRHV
jgi:hypothetical protein